MCFNGFLPADVISCARETLCTGVIHVIVQTFLAGHRGMVTGGIQTTLVTGLTEEPDLTLFNLNRNHLN